MKTIRELIEKFNALKKLPCETSDKEVSQFYSLNYIQRVILLRSDIMLRIVILPSAV